MDESKYFIDDFTQRGYTFINYTKSMYKKGSFDEYDSPSNTHDVIGQEFNNVLMLIDSTFYYDKSGWLVASTHPNPDYLYSQLLFQGVTRAREKIAIIIVDNIPVFDKVLQILS